MLELLGVIVIISILMALLIPAIIGVLGQADVAEVKAEITQLDASIKSFESNYRIEPWSEVVLTEDPSSTAWDSISMTKIRRIWPQFDFTLTNDFNDDGDTTDVLTLTASECLVFFLGGVQDGEGVIGFSKNPISPFSRSGDNRTDILFIFDGARLVDGDSDGMFEYVDPMGGQSNQYHYASSNNGQGYDATVFHYLDGADKPWSPNTHQIIAVGKDGVLKAAATAMTPVYTIDIDLSGANRLDEADNITNFSDGTLN